MVGRGMLLMWVLVVPSLLHNHRSTPLRTPPTSSTPLNSEKSSCSLARSLLVCVNIILQSDPAATDRFIIFLAAKAALAIRCDALGDNEDSSMGVESRLKLEARLRNLEGGELSKSAGSAKGKPKIEFYDKDHKKGSGGLITPAKTYNPAADSVMGRTPDSSVKDLEMTPAKDTKEKKKKKKSSPEDATVDLDTTTKKGKKEKKQSTEEKIPKTKSEPQEAATEEKKKKKRKHAEVVEDGQTPSKKDKKKKV